MIEEFCRVLREKLREESETELRGLARGAAKDFSGYQYACGVIRGLELAEQHVIDLRNAAESAE